MNLRIYPPVQALIGMGLMLLGIASGQTLTDSDGDSLSDRLEDTLLQQFQPTLMVSDGDCSVRPARFQLNEMVPTVVADDGTLYGQAHPRAGTKGSAPQIELHFYHLWRKDCGRMGHALDAEHVAVLLERDTGI